MKTLLEAMMNSKTEDKSALDKSTNALDEIDRLAGDDEKLQKLGRKLGLNDFKKYLKDNNLLKEANERYYYGEIERVKDTIRSEVIGIGHIRKALQEAYDENQGDYSQEMIDIIGEADAYFEGVEKKCEEISNKLSKAFPNRIRQLTPEEKAEINKMLGK